MMVTRYYRAPVARTMAYNPCVGYYPIMDEYLIEIGDLRPDEYRAAAELVGRAMRDLPYAVAIWGNNPDRRARGLRLLMDLLLPITKRPPLCARHEGLLVGIVGAAPPGTCVPAPAESLSLVPRLFFAGPRDFLRMNRYFNQMFRHDPRSPHWHIGPVAVEPAVQGLGVGRRLMEALGERVDEAGEMAHLETDNPENVRFYERAGFETAEVVEVMGVRNWLMRRQAAELPSMNASGA
jgi:hypothetical protein